MTTSRNENGKKEVVIRSYRLWELMLLYGISKYLMKSWLSKYQTEIGKKDGQFYNAKQVKVIFELLPLPSDCVIIE